MYISIFLFINIPRIKSSIFNRNFVAVKLFAMENINRYIISQLKRPVDRLELMAIGNIINFKWELIVTHTGRRTCATNMYLSRKYTTREMMLVTGHKKEENFMRHIKHLLDE